MNLDARGSDDLLDQLLAELDENPDAPVDSTVRNLHAELATLADDLRQPLPPDPYGEESALRLAVARAQKIGREASSRSANVVEAAPPSGLGHVGPYRLLEKLGQGGMGTVFKALHVRLEKVVALKVLSANRTSSAESVSRFAREMKAVGKLDHPHIVRAMDAGEADGTHYLVMEYVEGIDFSELLKRVGRLPIADACELIRQAALGLQAAHSRGMVHRDVKPANLMLASQEFGPPVVKVLDLGLALLSDTTGGDVGGLTTDGHIMGTLDYMAPEQAGDSHAVDIRADIYSLGATLYALLTGGSIFHGRIFKTALHRISALANEQVPPITDRRDDVPPALAAIVRRMLARDPADRFDTPADVAAALGPFAAGADLSALLSAAPAEAEALGETGTWDTGDRVASSFQDTTRDSKPAIAKSSELAPLPAPRLRGGGGFRRPVVLVAAAALAGTALLGIILLSLRTPHGEVVVELADDVPKEMADKLRVEVRGNGDLKVADAEQGWTIDVSEGEYVARLAGGDDRFELERNQVTVTRDKKTVLRVTLKRTHGPGDEGSPGAPAVAAAPKAPVWKPTPEQQAFFDEVAKLDAEAQVEAVRQKLMEANPYFDGTLEPRFHEGRVVYLDFLADKVSEIWSIRGLTELQALNIRGSAPGAGGLTDLSPLAALPVTSLDCSNNSGFEDLSQLAGMPLTTFSCNDTGVSDLGPLAGSQLQKLYCSNTAVSDLAPLHGMRLTNLGFSFTKVSDLSPLAGMPLYELQFGYTGVTDLSPLRGMPLTILTFGSTGVSDLSPLRGMPLQVLGFRYVGISDFSPIAGMKLQELHCEFPPSRSQIEALLSGMPPSGTINGLPVGEYLLTLRFTPTPEQQAFFDAVAKLDPEEQVEAVREKMKEVNPEFDGNLWVQYAGAQVVDLHMRTDKVTAIWPVRALPNLQGLDVSANTGSQLSDLSPLAGLRLSSLQFSATQVSDLSPLAGMPLTSLDFDQCYVADLAPLKGAPLRKLDFLNNWGISDLSPLKGMPLEELDATNTSVADLSPLAGMRLTSLHFGGARVTDLSPLKGMPLKDLMCGCWGVSDLSPIAGMPLVHFDGGNSQIADLSPLSGMPLKSVSLGGCFRVTDLTALKGATLSDVILSDTGVLDLSPLTGMPLDVLLIDGAGVSDISPLAGMPLRTLHCSRTGVGDLSPLQGLPLERFQGDIRLFHADDETLIRSLPLKNLGAASGTDRTPDDFWREFETRRRAATAFADETAKLASQDQVAAVLAQFETLNPDGAVTMGHVKEDESVAAATLVLTEKTGDVTPLRAFSKLKRLTLSGGPSWLDLSPVNILPVEEITCREEIARRNAPVLAGMPTLKTINGQPAAEYLETIATRRVESFQPAARDPLK